MIINHNIAALNTVRQLSMNDNATQKSLQKLSSGLRINSAADDAAGLAISEKMKGQISGLEQASRNAQDGISLIQTGEGALNETTSILQRMRELAVQSGNDTNTNQDRSSIQDEMNQLTSEIDRISNTTQFNSKNLLDGSMGASVNASVKNVNTSAILKAGTGSAATLIASAGSDLLTSLSDSNGNSLGIASGDKITVSYVTNDGSFKSQTLTVSSTSKITDLEAEFTDGTAAATSTGTLQVTASTAGFTGAINGITMSVSDSSGNVKTAATNALSSFTETTAAANKEADGSATFQIGANTGQTLSLSIDNMGASALGVKGIQVSTQSEATSAIKVIDNAITKVSSERSKLGAYQNRLEHTINNLGTSSQNLTAAESSITDVDMAKEMMTYTKDNILSQTAQAMLAQAKQLPQGVLQLLR